MQRQEDRAIIAKADQLLKIIWIAFQGGALSYLVLGNLALRSTSGESTSSLEDLPLLLPLIFGLLAAAEVVAIQVLPRFLLQEERLRAAVERGPRPEQVARAGVGDPDPAQQTLIVLLGQYTNAKIVLWALAEAIAVYGIVLTFTLQTTTWLYPFVIVGLLLLILNPPRLGDFLEEHRGLLRRGG
jgi:hypothetical protein